ncbi:unnamed protein product [Porites evermanni]|uniref:Uncharacterized protein n=1 Tax=Porites evermanni TaxID=104178 RepID=A0ABN8MK16_9CNID|nr:unnamed protein product [Porites evermanni]
MSVHLGQLTRQKAGRSLVPMGTNSAPLLGDLFLRTLDVNNVDFGNYISAIYPSELELKDTSTSSTEVCYLDTNIKTGDINTPFRISICDIREMTLHFGLSTFLIWKAATFPPIQVTVFIYLSW